MEDREYYNEIKIVGLEQQQEYITTKWKSSGATKHTKFCNAKLKWIDLETFAQLKILLNKKIRKSLEINYLELRPNLTTF